MRLHPDDERYLNFIVLVWIPLVMAVTVVVAAYFNANQ